MFSTNTNEHYEIPNDEFLEELKRNISSSTHCSEKTVTKQIATLSDTFDWRLYSKGYVLLQMNGEVRLISVKNDEIIDAMVWKKKKAPERIQQFTNGSLRNKIADTIKDRILIPVCKCEFENEIYECTDTDGKIIARVSLYTALQDTMDDSFPKQIISIERLKGYEQESSKYLSFFKTKRLSKIKSPFSEVLLKNSERVPGQYTSKFRISLSSQQTSREALLQILRYLTTQLMENYPYVTNPSDIEFLHDFRVSIRRIRAALRQISGVLPEEDVLYYANEFREIAQNSNTVRDMDVFLTERDTYIKLLPSALQQGIIPLFEHLHETHSDEFNKMKRKYNSKKTKDFLKKWQNYLDNSEEIVCEECPNSERNIREFASARILRRFKKIVQKSELIDYSKPDEFIHVIRLDCKKLRYLLEFFFSLYPPKKISVLISHLKSLQDILGIFNDVYVQQIRFTGFLEELDDTYENKKGVAAAVGGIIAIAYRGQLDMLQKIEEAFSTFKNKKNTELYQSIFAQKKTRGTK